MLPQVLSASASSVTGPREEGDRFCASHHAYASGVATWIGGTATRAGCDAGPRHAKLPFAAAPRQRERRAAGEERHIGAELRGEMVDLVSWYGVPGQRVHGV